MMRNESISPVPSSWGERATPTRQPAKLSGAAVRIACALAAPFAFFAAGMCFYFLIEPFGTNPPPREVALGVGIAFSCVGLFFVGVAIFYRGSVPLTQTPQGWNNHKLPDLTRWSQPAGVGAAVGSADAVAPPQRRKRGSLTDFLGAAAILGILIGPGVGYLTYQREQVLKRGKAQPTTMSVADLGREGPGKNIHVKLTDFEYGDKLAVRSKNGRWSSICLAAFPRGQVNVPRSLKVVVRTSQVHTDQELQEFGKRATVQGVVVNSIYEWTSDREYMKEAYPGVDTSSIWVVQEDYNFPTPSEIQTMYTVSSGIVGFAVFCGLIALIRKWG